MERVLTEIAAANVAELQRRWQAILDVTDHGPRRIVVIPSKDSTLVTSRTAPPSALLSAGQAYWSSALIDSIDPPETATIIASAEMFVTRRGDDLVVRRMSSGRELDFFEVIGDLMSGVVAKRSSQPHRWRISHA